MTGRHEIVTFMGIKTGESVVYKRMRGFEEMSTSRNASVILRVQKQTKQLMMPVLLMTFLTWQIADTMKKKLKLPTLPEMRQAQTLPHILIVVTEAVFSDGKHFCQAIQRVKLLPILS